MSPRGHDVPRTAGGPPAGVARIARTTLHDAVLNQVRDMIIEGTLPPGTRVNEVLVGAGLGVSRTPLREALKTLASEGLVEMLPARGAFVRRFGVADIRETLGVLKILEQAAARLACAVASDREIEAVAALHDEMMGFYAERSRLAYFKLNQSIHSAMVRASGNAVLAQLHDQLQARIKRVRFIGNEKPERWAAAVREHESMNAALLRRDAEALSAVLGEHLDRTLDRVRDVI